MTQIFKRALTEFLLAREKATPSDREQVRSLHARMTFDARKNV